MLRKRRCAQLSTHARLTISGSRNRRSFELWPESHQLAIASVPSFAFIRPLRLRWLLHERGQRGGPWSFANPLPLRRAAVVVMVDGTAAPTSTYFTYCHWQVGHSPQSVSALLPFT